MRHVLFLSAGLILAGCSAEPHINQARIAQVHEQTLTLDSHIDIPLN